MDTIKTFLNSNCVQDTLWRMIDCSQTVISQESNDLRIQTREELVATLEKLFEGEGLDSRQLEHIESMLNDAYIMKELLWHKQYVIAQHDTGTFSKLSYYKIDLIKKNEDDRYTVNMEETFAGIEVLLKSMTSSSRQQILLNVTLPNVQKALNIIPNIKDETLESLKKIRPKRSYKTYYGRDFDDIIPILISVIQKTISEKMGHVIIAEHREEIESVFDEAPNEIVKNEHVQEFIEKIILPIIEKVLSSIEQTS